MAVPVRGVAMVISAHCLWNNLRRDLTLIMLIIAKSYRVGSARIHRLRDKTIFVTWKFYVQPNQKWFCGTIRII